MASPPPSPPDPGRDESPSRRRGQILAQDLGAPSDGRRDRHRGLPAQPAAWNAGGQIYEGRRPAFAGTPWSHQAPPKYTSAHRR